MKEKPPIPKCKNPACQCDLFPERAWSYDKRIKYCEACGKERKKSKDSIRMENVRKQSKAKVKALEMENEELKRQHEHDVLVMERLQAEIAQLRDWDRRTVNDYR